MIFYTFLIFVKINELIIRNYLLKWILFVLFETANRASMKSMWNIARRRIYNKKKHEIDNKKWKQKYRRRDKEYMFPIIEIEIVTTSLPPTTVTTLLLKIGKRFANNWIAH